MSLKWSTKAIKATPVNADELLIIDSAAPTTNKRILIGTLPTSLPFADSSALIEGSVDTTKLLRFEIDGFTTATTRVLTPPDADGVIVLEGFSQTLINKSIDAATNTLTIASTDLTDTANIVLNNQANSYTAGVRQDFLGLLAGTSGLNVGGIAGNPTTQVNGDIWLNTSSNTLFGRINGADVDLGGAGEFLGPWTANHDAGGFDLDNVGDLSLSKTGSVRRLVIERPETLSDFSIIGTIQFNTNDGTPTSVPYADVTVLMESDVNAAEQASISFGIMNAGSVSTYMAVNTIGSGQVRITNFDLFLSGNDLLSVGNITFTDNTGFLTWAVGETISIQGGQMTFDVLTGNAFNFAINGITEMQLLAAGLKLFANPLFFNATDESISIQSGNMVFDVPTTDTFNFDIATSTEYIFNSTELSVQGNNVIDWFNLISANNQSIISTNGDLTIEGAPGDTLNLSIDGSPLITMDDGGPIDFNSFSLTNLGATLMVGRFQYDKGVNVAAASTTTLGTDGNVFTITIGTGTINEISPSNWQTGSMVYLEFNAVVTVTNNSGGINDILLGDGANFVTAAGDVLTLFFDGTDWREVSRSTVGAGGGGDVSSVGTVLNRQVAIFVDTTGKLIDEGGQASFPGPSVDTAGKMTIERGINFTTNGILAAGEETIWAASNNLRVNATVSFQVFIADSQNYSFTATHLDFEGNNLLNAGVMNFDLAGSTALAGGEPFISYDIGLTPDTMRFNVPTGTEFAWYFNGTEQMSFDGAILDGAGAGGTPASLENFSDLILAAVSDMEIRFGATTSAVSQTIGTINFEADQSDAGLIDYCRIVGNTRLTTDATAAGRMDLMCLEGGDAAPIAYITLNGQLEQIIIGKDITMANLPIESIGSAQFATGGVTPAGTIDYIKADPTELLINVPAGEEIHLTFNGGTADYTFSTSVFDITGAQIQNCNILFSNAGAALVATTGFIRMGNDQLLGWRNAGDTDNHTITFNASDEFEIALTGVTADYTFSETEADFLGNNIINVPFLEDNSATPATDGVIRVGNGQFGIRWRNNAGSGNVGIAVNINDDFSFQGGNIVTEGNDLVLQSGIIEWTTGETISMQTNDMIFDITTGDFFSWDIAGTPEMQLSATTLTLSDAIDIAVNATTGTKIATATTQKIGFWNVTPVVQPTHIADPAGGGTVDAEARTAINSILAQLAATGLQASA